MDAVWRTTMALLAAAAGMASGAPASDLFHPVPNDRLREMSTDRPDQTESPYTLDAGHLQLEMDVVTGSFDRGQSGEGEVRTAAWGIAPLNFKLGLLHRVDVQFVLGTFVHSRIEDRTGGMVEHAAGFGDLLTRVKVNFWGDDGGRTAFGIMPFLKWPLPHTGLRNGRTEGGLIFPFALNLGRGWDLGAMTEIDLTARDAGGYGAGFINSVTVGRGVTRKLGVYAEFFALAGAPAGRGWQGQADAGLTYAASKNVQLDAGCNFGVTRSAPDFRPFVGLSVRR